MGDEDRFWLCFNTHGNETGINAMNHCETVVLWGTLHESDNAISSKLAAVEDNLDTDYSQERVTYYLNSERHHRVLQAISRGAMRNPQDGKPDSASPMVALVVDRDTTLGPPWRPPCRASNGATGQAPRAIPSGGVFGSPPGGREAGWQDVATAEGCRDACGGWLGAGRHLASS